MLLILGSIEPKPLFISGGLFILLLELLTDAALLARFLTISHNKYTE